MKTRDELLAENETQRQLLEVIAREQGIDSEAFHAALEAQIVIHRQIADLDNTG